jgi:hypothetical protein
MTPAQIKRKWASIARREEKLAHDLAKLQALCPHTNHHKKNEGTGSMWCKDDEAYWIEHYCPDCRKRWSTDQ